MWTAWHEHIFFSSYHFFSLKSTWTRTKVIKVQYTRCVRACIRHRFPWPFVKFYEHRMLFTIFYLLIFLCFQVKFSPRWHSVFLSCSADWTIGVWHLHSKVRTCGLHNAVWTQKSYFTSVLFFFIFVFHFSFFYHSHSIIRNFFISGDFFIFLLQLYLMFLLLGILYLKCIYLLLYLLCDVW